MISQKPLRRTVRLKAICMFSFGRCYQTSPEGLHQFHTFQQWLRVYKLTNTWHFPSFLMVMIYVVCIFLMMDEIYFRTFIAVEYLLPNLPSIFFPLCLFL